MTAAQYCGALGTFTPKVRLLKQRDIIGRLYDCFNSAESKVDDDLEEEDTTMQIAGPLIHRLLLSFYMETLDVKELVDSAVEQSLALATMTVESDKYTEPNVVTKSIACTVRTMLSSYLHSAWHGGVDHDFVLDVKPLDLAANPDDGELSLQKEEDNRASETEAAPDSVFAIMVSTEDQNYEDIYEGVSLREDEGDGIALVQSNILMYVM